jgi:hypothetical protein
MKIRKVSADMLDRPSQARSRELSPRQQKRRALEQALETAISRAASESDAAFRLDLDDDEKAATVRAAFRRVRERTGATAVNLFARDDALIVAKRPQTRGRRPKQ